MKGEVDSCKTSSPATGSTDAAPVMATLSFAAYFGCAAIFLSSSAPFVTSAGGGGEKTVAFSATAFGFYAFSGRETADAKRC